MLTLAGAICHTEPAGFLAIHLNVPACVIRAFSITSLDRPARLSGLQSKRACEQHSHNAILIDREYSVKTHELLLPEFKNSKTMHCAGYSLTLPLAHQTYFAVHVCALVCLKNNCDEKPWSINKKSHQFGSSTYHSATVYHELPSPKVGQLQHKSQHKSLNKQAK